MTAAVALPNPHVPLIARKHWSEHNAESWHEHVVALYYEPPVKASAQKKAPPWTVNVNKKGAVALRVNRKTEPKYLTPDEFDEAWRAYCEHKPMALSAFGVFVAKRKVRVMTHERYDQITKTKQETVQ